MNEPITYFITWTTYGNWLPGDHRGWRKWKAGEQQPQPLLEAWCKNRMNETPVLLNEEQRKAVEAICHRHAEIRGWELHAVSARSNHVQLVVTADADPEKVRDQFKANATRTLRQQPSPTANEKVWARGGRRRDCRGRRCNRTSHSVYCPSPRSNGPRQMMSDVNEVSGIPARRDR